MKVGESQFAQAVIQDVTTAENDYWELVYSIENIKVEETTVAADQQLYDNNKKQLEIGTLAPLDVITAESQLATDQQALVQAQTTRLQDETKLLNDITKDPLSARADRHSNRADDPDHDAGNRREHSHSRRGERSLAKAAGAAAGGAEPEKRGSGSEGDAGTFCCRQLNLFGEYQANGLAGNQHTTQCPPGVTGRVPERGIRGARHGLAIRAPSGFVGTPDNYGRLRFSRRAWHRSRHA